MTTILMGDVLAMGTIIGGFILKGFLVFVAAKFVELQLLKL